MERARRTRFQILGPNQKLEGGWIVDPTLVSWENGARTREEQEAAKTQDQDNCKENQLPVAMIEISANHLKTALFRELNIQ